MLFRTLIFLSALTVAVAAGPADRAAAEGERATGETRQDDVQNELNRYFEDDDFAGAEAFVSSLDVDEKKKRELRRLISTTRAERVLAYAKIIRESIAAADIETMRHYSRRMQRLTSTSGNEGGTAEPADARQDLADGTEAAAGDETEQQTTADVEEEAGRPMEPEVRPAEPAADRRAAVEQHDQEVSDLLRLGREAIAGYHLTVAPEGTMSALDAIDRLMTVGGDGREAAAVLARRSRDIYRTLIERDIERGRYAKARIFVDRMATIEDHAGLSSAQLGRLRARIDEAVAGERHELLLGRASELREQGRLVTPAGASALSAAAEAVRLGHDPAAARSLLDGVIADQRRRADRLQEDGRPEDAARELRALADALRTTEMGSSALLSDLEAEAADITRAEALPMPPPSPALKPGTGTIGTISRSCSSTRSDR